MSLSNDLDKKIETIRLEQNILHKAKLIYELLRSEDLRLKDLAQRLNMKSPYLCHLLRLRKLPDIIMDGFYSKQISLSHLFIISRLPDKEKMIQAYEKILSESLTAKKTEEIIREMLFGIKTKGDYIRSDEKSEFVNALTTRDKHLSAELIQSRIKSKLTIEMKGDLELTTKAMKSLMSAIRNWQPNDVK